MTHIDLFTGLGGFTLACKWNGIETEVFCENDKRCQQFLRRTYPDVPIVPDIREFDGTRWRGRFLLTAGVPCQPASRAGKQRGKGDDRWLWPETLRVVSEARPDWVLFENPLGINDVGLDGILADLESLDYEVSPPLIIPACAVNSPQLRNRYWIVAHSANAGYEYGQFKAELQEKETSFIRGDFGASQSHMADTAEQGHQGCRTDQPRAVCPELAEQGERRVMPDSLHRSDSEKSYMADTVSTGSDYSEKQTQAEPDRNGEDRGIYQRSDWIQGFWSNSVWLPCADGKVRRAPDDSFSVAHGLHRSVLAALGNSIVPQVAKEIIMAIKQTQTA